MQGPQCPLQVRILFHCAHKTGQEQKLVDCHQLLTDSLEDQLSLASIHYLRGHYQVCKLPLCAHTQQTRGELCCSALLSVYMERSCHKYAL